MYFKETPNRYIIMRDSGTVINTVPKTRTTAMWAQGNEIHYIKSGMHFVFDKNGRKTIYKDPKKRSVFNKNYKPGTYGAYASESASVADIVRLWAESVLA